MTTIKKKTKMVNNPKGCPQNFVANKYVVADVLEEVRTCVDIDDFDSIVSWAIKQPYSKVKFCVDKCTDLPMVVKSLCAALLADLKWGRVTAIQMALERVVGKPVERQQVDLVDSTPKLTINVSSDIVQDNLDKLLGGPTDANDKDVR